MKNLRIIIWSILLGISLILGIIGFSYKLISLKPTESEITLLNKISENYNESEYVKNLNSKNIVTSSIVKGKNIQITYLNNKYTFKYGNNYFTSSFQKNDISLLILKLLTSAVNTNLGKSETDTFTLFETINEKNINDNESLKIITTNNNIINIKLSTIIPLKLNENQMSEYYIDLINKNIDKIKNFDFNYSDNNITINILNTSNKSIEIYLNEECKSISEIIVNTILDQTLNEKELETYNEITLNKEDLNELETTYFTITYNNTHIKLVLK